MFHIEIDGDILRWAERWAAKETARTYYQPGNRVRVRKG